MKSIIEEMYNGTLRPLNEVKNQTQENKDLSEKLLDEWQNITDKFPECKENFEKYLDMFEEHESKFAYEQFIKGFQIGARLMLEMIYPIE